MRIYYLDHVSLWCEIVSKMAEVYGGYDYEFVCQVAGRLNCQICAKVLREPHLVVCSGQHFCESCLNEWLKKQRKQSCPHCRAQGKAFNHVINKGLRSEINQLRVNCSNRVNGCQWTGELGSLKTHLESEKGCGYIHGCGMPQEMFNQDGDTKGS